MKYINDLMNESKVENELNRKFDQQKELTVVVSDLTY
jgi:putative transposase